MAFVSFRALTYLLVVKMEVDHVAQKEPKDWGAKIESFRNIIRTYAIIVAQYGNCLKSVRLKAS